MALPARFFFEPLRLRRALFYLLEHALESIPRGATIKIEIRAQDGEAVLDLVSATTESVPGCAAAHESLSCTPAGQDQQLSRRLQLAIARGLIEAVGGELHHAPSPNALAMEVKLPLTSFPHS